MSTFIYVQNEHILTFPSLGDLQRFCHPPPLKSGNFSFCLPLHNDIPWHFPYWLLSRYWSSYLCFNDKNSYTFLLPSPIHISITRNVTKELLHNFCLPSVKSTSYPLNQVGAKLACGFAHTILTWRENI